MLPVGEKAVALIVGEEIGSFATYTKLYQRPVWPGGASGVTCGIGYDCGQHTAEQVKADWTGHIPDADVETLCTVAGHKGVDAQNRLRWTQSVVIPIAVAEAVFSGSTLPRYAQMTEAALPNCDKLASDAFGALVSLSYNRGAGGYHMDDDRHSEMADIADAMDRQAFGEVPPAFEAMKRLWPEGSDLWHRRQHEADMFRAAMTVEVPAAPGVSGEDTKAEPVAAEPSLTEPAPETGLLAAAESAVERVLASAETLTASA